jgi:hypothetical protein
MKRNALFVPVFIAIFIVLSAAVAVGAYGVRVAAVRRGIARAMEQFYAQETGNGFAQLARLDCWSSQHPAFISQVRCAAIIGHVVSNNDTAAFALADRELADDRTPERPSNAWQALFQLVSEQLDPAWLKEMGGRHPDPRAGYRALVHAVEATGDEQRLARLDQRIALLFGEAGLEGEPLRAPDSLAVKDVLVPPDFGEGRFAVAAGASIRCYDEQGKHCGDLVPGALVTVTETRDSNGGEVAVCLREGADTSQSLLVRTRDLVIRDGDLALLPPDVRSLLAEHGRASSRLRQARRRAAERNPHAAGYKEATAAYKAFASKVKRLTAARDKAEGDERTRYADELQKLKNEAPALRDAYETSKREYEEWKAANGGSIDNDPEVAAQQRQVDKIAQQLAPHFDT